MVKGLDNGSANSLTFQNMNMAETKDYFVEVSYYAVSERNLTFKVNSNQAETISVPPTGNWCFQGGIPGDYTFKINLSQGENTLVFYDAPIVDKITILADTTARKASAIYISSLGGNDNNNGLTPEFALQSLTKVNALDLLPGDSLLFKSGEIFIGELEIKNEGGTPENPIFIGSFGEGEKPVFDGDGFLSTIHIVNSGNIIFSNLEIKNNGGPSKEGVSEDLRYGMFLENTFSDGTIFENYKLENLTFKNIFPTTEVTDDDNTGVNAHAITTSGSWGDDEHPSRFRNILIENCFFTRTARHAAVFKAIDSLTIRNNLFEHVGGAGMVISNNCTNILVEKNVTNYTGSKIDPRMAGRGSGIWCYRSKNLTVQHNKFMHAHGIHDSYGMHIDIGNRNVVYQYNYSEDNEGGFVEILGANVNVGYRYNLSVGDGWRKRGNRMGQIFWLAGWSGDPKNPVGSDSIFVYNNSIYVRDSISPGIWIEAVSKNACIYNNSIKVANDFGPVVIKNNSDFNDFDFNIWYGNIPETDENGNAYRGLNAITSNPLYNDEIVIDSSGFKLQAESPAIHAGKLIYSAENTASFSCFDNNGGIDYFGNSVSFTQNPNIGAYNGNPVGVGIIKNLAPKEIFKIYPNPLQNSKLLVIETNNNFVQTNAKIQIFGMDGKLWMEQFIQVKNKNTLNTSLLPSGNYIVKMTTGKFFEAKKLHIY